MAQKVMTAFNPNNLKAGFIKRRHKLLAGDAR